MTKVIIYGIGGRLGQTLLNCINNDDSVTAVAGVDKFCDKSIFSIPVYDNADLVTETADIIIDFSRPDAVYEILPLAAKKKMAVILSTTGYTDEHEKFIASYADKVAIFQSANMSLGINLLIDLAKKASNALGTKFEIEIIEKHHNLKVDSPSGTALAIANAINAESDDSYDYVYGRHSRNERRKANEIGIHAVRGGTIVGEHDVMFIGNDEVLTISHQATSKAVFAEGAIKAAKFLKGKPAGRYNMQDILSELNK